MNKIRNKTETSDGGLALQRENSRRVSALEISL